MSLPKHTKAWTLDGQQEDFTGLKLVDELPIPELKDDEVLVKIYAVSLNYRDLVVVKVWHVSCVFCK
jgi:NADPH:quinone reductase-like Zn-dependent oxidoreductase